MGVLISLICGLISLIGGINSLINGLISLIIGLISLISSLFSIIGCVISLTCGIISLILGIISIISGIISLISGLISVIGGLISLISGQRSEGWIYFTQQLWMDFFLISLVRTLASISSQSLTIAMLLPCPCRGWVSTVFSAGRSVGHYSGVHYTEYSVVH